MAYSAESASKSSCSQLPFFIADHAARYEAQTRHSRNSAHSLLLGPKPTPGTIDLSSNDYLALGHHAEIVEAQVRELRCSGSQQMMSGVLLDCENPQWNLERRFAGLARADAAILFQSGYQANVSLLQTIGATGRPIYLDYMAHASLFQGALAARTDIRLFRHNDVGHLRRELHSHGPGVICVDSVYSTNGSLAPLAEVADAAEEYGCALVVDESHSLGTHGPGGAGLVVELGLEGRVHFRTASLAKAFCGRAGLVVCPDEIAYCLRFSSLPNIFSSSVMPHDLAAFAKTLEIVEREEWRRDKLRLNAERLRVGLAAIGYNVAASGSQIIALEAGSEQRLVQLTLALRSRGLFGSPFFAPATARNRTCLRLSVHAALTATDLNRVIAVCDEVREDAGVATWPSTRRTVARERTAGLFEDTRRRQRPSHERNASDAAIKQRGDADRLQSLSGH